MLVDTRRLSYAGAGSDPLAALVFSPWPEPVDTVMVNGRIVVEGGELTGVDVPAPRRAGRRHLDDATDARVGPSRARLPPEGAKHLLARGIRRYHRPDRSTTRSPSSPGLRPLAGGTRLLAAGSTCPMVVDLQALDLRLVGGGRLGDAALAAWSRCKS